MQIEISRDRPYIEQHSKLDANVYAVIFFSLVTYWQMFKKITEDASKPKDVGKVYTLLCSTLSSSKLEPALWGQGLHFFKKKKDRGTSQIL